tara:strand:+ start:55 stop:378 length:324 start_codon:yes stop_codon:yes gene_type:complete
MSNKEIENNKSAINYDEYIYNLWDYSFFKRYEHKKRWENFEPVLLEGMDDKGTPKIYRLKHPIKLKDKKALKILTKINNLFVELAPFITNDDVEQKLSDYRGEIKTS